MWKRRLSIAFFAGVLAVTALAVPPQSEACEFLDRLFGCGSSAPTYPTYAPTYAPAYSAPACGPTCAPAGGCATCVPQTTYRPVVQSIPVTRYVPATSCDPCTGCARTTYRPITTVTRQVRMVPYTTYRRAYMPNYGACATCPSYGSCVGGACSTGACSTGGCYGGSCAATYTPTSGCTSCGPSTSLADPYTGSSDTGNDSERPSTFENNDGGATEQGLKPIPDVDAQLNSTPAAPRLIDPDNRTTARPIRHVAHIQLVNSPIQPAPAEPARSASGWRASRD